MKDKRKVTNKLMNENVDSSIIQYIDDSIKGIESKLEIAIAIYIKLAQLFWYNSAFVVENDYSLIEDLSAITMDNNYVVCLHWAIIYSKLLDRYGINNRLCGDDEHLMVKVIVDDYVIFADATKYGVDYGEYMLADLTNAKLGIKINNFCILSESKNKELDSLINSVYSKLGMKYYDLSRVEQLINKFKKYAITRLKRNEEKGLPRIDRKEILMRIKCINSFYHLDTNLHEVERMQFFSKYYSEFFVGFDYDTCRCITLSELDDNYSLIRMIVAKDDLDNIYYFLETEEGFVEYEKNKLLELFEERNIYFRHDICCVLGFQDSEVKRLSKVCI